jgi:serine O-acetyltransferase
MLLLELLVRLCGGFWSLREKCLRTRAAWPRALYRRLYHAHQSLGGSLISLETEFAGRPVFPHGRHGVFISGEARVGRGCIVFQQVTIGSNALPDSRGLGAPVIGDNCYLGAGAKIIGRVRIGDNVRVGANCVVTRDVPDDSVVVSNVQTIIRKEKLVNRAYTYRGAWGYLEGERFTREPDPEVVRRLEEAFPRGD